MITDHLGSVVATTSASGALISQQRYMPFGQVRTITSGPITQTDFGFTGQRNNSYINLDAQGTVSPGAAGGNIRSSFVPQASELPAARLRAERAANKVVGACPTIAYFADVRQRSKNTAPY